MSHLNSRIRDQLCVEVHHKYQQQKKGRPLTPYFPNKPSSQANRLPPILSENSMKTDSYVDKSKPSSKSDFSILRFRFGGESSTHSKDCFFGSGEDLASSAFSTTPIEDAPASPSMLDSSTPFGSKKLQQVKKQQSVASNVDLVRKWSDSAHIVPGRKASQRHYGTNEVLSIAIQSYGRGVKISRTCCRNKSRGKPPALGSLPSIQEGKELQTFATKFRPIKVHDDRVLIAQERKEFHGYGLYTNPKPHDHRGVR